MRLLVPPGKRYPQRLEKARMLAKVLLEADHARVSVLTEKLEALKTVVATAR